MLIPLIKISVAFFKWKASTVLLS